MTAARTVRNNAVGGYDEEQGGGIDGRPGGVHDRRRHPRRHGRRRGRPRLPPHLPRRRPLPGGPGLTRRPTHDAAAHVTPSEPIATAEPGPHHPRTSHSPGRPRAPAAADADAGGHGRGRGHGIRRPGGPTEHPRPGPRTPDGDAPPHAATRPAPPEAPRPLPGGPGHRRGGHGPPHRPPGRPPAQLAAGPAPCRGTLAAPLPGVRRGPDHADLAPPGPRTPHGARPVRHLPHGGAAPGGAGRHGPAPGEPRTRHGPHGHPRDQRLHGPAVARGCGGHSLVPHAAPLGDADAGGRDPATPGTPLAHHGAAHDSGNPLLPTPGGAFERPHLHSVRGRRAAHRRGGTDPGRRTRRDVARPLGGAGGGRGRGAAAGRGGLAGPGPGRTAPGCRRLGHHGPHPRGPRTPLPLHGLPGGLPPGGPSGGGRAAVAGHAADPGGGGGASASAASGGGDPERDACFGRGRRGVRIPGGRTGFAAPHTAAYRAGAYAGTPCPGGRTDRRASGDGAGGAAGGGAFTRRGHGSCGGAFRDGHSGECAAVGRGA